MEFKGRQELVIACEESILTLKNHFIHTSIEFCKHENIFISRERKQAIFEDIFDSLLLLRPDANKLYDELSEIIKDEKIRENYINFSMLGLVLNFNKLPNVQNYVGFFVNAIERMKQTLSKLSTTKELTYDVPNLNTSSFFFENTIDTLSRMKNANKKPEFLNLYDGVNIKNEAEILKVHEDSVVFGMDVMQILAMKQEGSGFILPNEFFPQHIKADIVDFSTINKTVTLANFTRISKMNANLRKHQRVHPNRFTKVTLKNQISQLDGNLYDISDGGLSVLSSNIGDFRQGDSLEANFELLMPKTNKIYNVSIKPILITELAYKGCIRYCLQIPQDQSSDIVHEFTTARVEETLEELKAHMDLYK
ncbi:PilZ domain-containing protein [Campylobacter sp. RM9344]|uniref:PilZ domain-containing protein n=1 Tax=Campylobacter californiensis TaxID=1032243 RepID=A0AAW3ZRL4_9BACT|nr:MULTISPECIES: PilZ domain-containing protein [unclassified Campylobacter]MBE2984185.1 PilZ domain-containing protein [Campylobacter sp. RM6883]MBE2995554.1 PilZ domain-containing protein [Campylobacter sp. RM6913]MBE3029777.1 PilZ domain-containing protein [Campylobacter sp. RM9344]MBE3607762.1 PilZ domain-containing protein [Campylobacter sp. RM9337]QCD51370.1 hypothetical protein CCAL_1487 [Campylobacter sp. RM6914]